MRLSVFTKLFLIYAILMLVPVILISFLIVLNYEQSLEIIFGTESKIAFSLILQSLYLALIEIKMQIIFAIILIILLHLIISIVLTKMILKPLQSLNKGIAELNKDNFDFQIITKSRDEFGDMANHFNKMAYKLKEARASLKEANVVLESKVFMRTKELENLIKSMDETIKNKTHELQKRVNELEAIHRLSVGRELKMIELKEELERTKKRQRSVNSIGAARSFSDDKNQSKKNKARENLIEYN